MKLKIHRNLAAPWPPHKENSEVEVDDGTGQRLIEAGLGTLIPEPPKPELKAVPKAKPELKAVEEATSKATDDLKEYKRKATEEQSTKGK